MADEPQADAAADKFEKQSRSRFNEQVQATILRLAALGLTDQQLAGVLQCRRETIWHWKKRHPDFFEKLKCAKRSADQQVVASLFQRACGYSHESVKIHVGRDGTVTTVPYIEYYPPDTLACIFWLKNRDPEQWRDRNILEHETGANATDLAERLTKALARTTGIESDEPGNAKPE